MQATYPKVAGCGSLTGQVTTNVAEAEQRYTCQFSISWILHNNPCGTSYNWQYLLGTRVLVSTWHDAVSCHRHRPKRLERQPRYQQMQQHH